MIHLAVVLLALGLMADTPEPPLAPPLGIRLPVFPGPVVPPPPPVPQPFAGVPKLTKDLLYVFDADVECVVLSSPDGLVKITARAGPVTFYGPFIDAPDKRQFRELKGKFVYVVEPLVNGRCELIVLPVGVKAAAEIRRQTIDVDAGQGPQPPTPPIPTPPTPTPTPPIPGDGLRVVIVAETTDLAKLPKQQVAIFTSQKLSAGLNDACVKVNGKSQWRIYDPDTDVTNDDPILAAALKRSRKSLPWIVISNGKSGTEEPLPKTVDEVLALVNKYKVP